MNAEKDLSSLSWEEKYPEIVLFKTNLFQYILGLMFFNDKNEEKYKNFN